MKRIALLLVPALLIAASVAVAGEGGECSYDTQTCLNYLAEKAESKGWMGIEAEPVAETGFVVIKAVTPESPAAKAGFKTGMVVTAVNGTTINTNDQEATHATMALMVPDAEITFTVKNDYGKQKDIKVTLQTMPEDEALKMVGKHMLDHVKVADSSSK